MKIQELSLQELKNLKQQVDQELNTRIETTRQLQEELEYYDFPLTKEAVNFMEHSGFTIGEEL